MKDKYNILVIDDERIVLDSIGKILKNEPEYSLTLSQSPDESLQNIQNNNYHIILTDLMMPEIDGLEILKKAKERNENTQVIMITGYATINTALQAMQLGAFDYLSKPFTKDELKRVIQRCVEFISKSSIENTIQTISEMKREGQFSGLTGIGKYCWLMREDDGNVLIGIERSLLYTVGYIQTVYLPSKGDEIRQGSVFFQIFSNDLRAQSVTSPLSGIVIEVNQIVLDEPNSALADPYDRGWLIKLKPENFEEEVKLLGR